MSWSWPSLGLIPLSCCQHPFGLPPRTCLNSAAPITSTLGFRARRVFSLTNLPRVAFSSVQSGHLNMPMSHQLYNLISICSMENSTTVAFHTTHALMALWRLSIITQLRIWASMPLLTAPLRTLRSQSRTLWRHLRWMICNLMGVQMLIPVAIVAVTWLSVIFLRMLSVDLPPLFCLGVMFQILVNISANSYPIWHVRHVRGLATKQSTLICLQLSIALNGTWKATSPMLLMTPSSPIGWINGRTVWTTLIEILNRVMRA